MLVKINENNSINWPLHLAVCKKSYPQISEKLSVNAYIHYFLLKTTEDFPLEKMNNKSENENNQ